MHPIMIEACASACKSALNWHACLHLISNIYKDLYPAGDQFESTKSNTPKLKFGTSLREASEKIFISTDHEKSG